MKEVLFVKFSNERNDRFKIKTAVVRENGKKYVEKSAVGSVAQEHIDLMLKNYNALNESYINDRVMLAGCEAVGNALHFEYIDGIGLDERLDSLIFEKNDVDAAICEIENYFAALTDTSDRVEFEGSTEFEEIFGAVRLDGYECCKISNIDAAFSNVILNENGYNIIDYEWTYSFPIPLKYIKYRTVLNYILDNPHRGVIADHGIFEKMGISSDESAVFDEMEHSFQKYVYSGCLDFRAFYKSLRVTNYNMVAAAEKCEADTFKNIVDVFFDYGEGVVPESVKSFFNINKDGHGCIELSLENINGLRAVRIDPVTDYCILTDVDIKVCENGKDSTPDFGCNGYGIGEKNEVLLFTDPDVQFYIAVNDKTDSVKMSYDIISISKEDAERLRAQVEEERKNTSQVIDTLNRNIEQQGREISSRNEEIEKRNAVIAQKEQLIREKEAEISCRIAEIESKNSVIDELNRVVVSKESRIEGLNGIIAARDNQINEIYNSTCWKITAPLRYTVGGTKKFFRNNPITGGAYEFLFYVKKLGLKGAMQHYKGIKYAQPISASASEGGMPSVIFRRDIKPIEGFNKKIAVHLHLYYVDLLDEFFGFFSNIPYKFDLFVSCREDSDLADVKKRFKKLKNVNKVDVRKTINRGRDIAPLYVQFGEEISGYDYFLHVHSKKSVYSGKEQYGWRRYSLECLLKDEQTVKEIFDLFESSKIGLFYPETFGQMPMIAQDWLENAAGGRRLLGELGIPFEDGFFNYPVGSFFWARVDALKPLFDRHLVYEDFPEEAGQTDGTLAHVLERAIAFIAKSRGYIDAISDIRNDYIRIGKSYKVYEPYFAVNVNNAKQYLSGFDVISFDIFDTLITRKIYNPDDIFELMRIKTEKELNISCDYLKARKSAEAAAWEKKGAYTSIDDIYMELPQVLGISQEQAESLKKMEIELELELCVPRRDMLEIFNYLKGCGKKIVLVSDMYLTGEIIGDMLKKCGYDGWNDMWVSCEKGLRKDSNSMWDEFFACYGELKTVHVGDNPQSDIQRVIDRHRETFFVINPRTAFKMSASYNRFMSLADGGIGSSLMLGMFVNEGIYNSPFCQKIDGEPDISEYSVMGYSAFGPVFAAFSLWLNTVTENDSFLIFLAREGYIFEDFYKRLYEKSAELKRKTAYFLASRRAVSVAAIRSEDEVRSILAQYYRGSLSNLLKSRLGVELYDDLEDRFVSMADDLDTVMNELKPHLDDILKRAEGERENYIAYIKQLGIKDNGVVVDVGYSGTIQYYLAKLLENRQPGAYLCTSANKKPEQLSCRCESLYPLKDIVEEKSNKIFRNQLFLEAVLKAPFGQLICFERENGEVKPCYKDDRIISDELRELQKGILNFASELGSAAEGIMENIGINDSLAAEMFAICLEEGWISEKVADIMTVQDDYCENGCHKFNAKTGEWEVIKN